MQEHSLSGFTAPIPPIVVYLPTFHRKPHSWQYAKVVIGSSALRVCACRGSHACHMTITQRIIRPLFVHCQFLICCPHQCWGPTSMAIMSYACIGHFKWHCKIKNTNSFHFPSILISRQRKNLVSSKMSNSNDPRAVF